MVHPLSAGFRDQARGCLPGSPLYGRLLGAMADDLDAGGITAEVMLGHEGDRPGTVPALRLAGALHRLVLAGQAPALARYYPSAGGTEPADAVWSAVEPALRTHLDELRRLVGRTVQTNETGRASLLYGGLLVASQRAAADRLPELSTVGAPPSHAEEPAAMPVRLLEVGASAGLMMLVDRYGYGVGDRVLGDPASPLRLREPWVGAPEADLDVPVTIVERRGCDPNPIDPASADGRLTLQSYVWPDWSERIDRLAAALALAAADPPPVDRAGMAAWLGVQLAEPRPGVLTVVWHSVVRQYVDFAERDAAQVVLARAAAAATPEAPLAYLRFEPRRLDDRSVRFELTLTRWPAPGEDELLATAYGHGLPATWR